METNIINIGYINFILSCVRWLCVITTPYCRMQWLSCVIYCSSDSDGDSDSDSDHDGSADEQICVLTYKRVTGVSGS
jgi:hypothetical protein